MRRRNNTREETLGIKYIFAKGIINMVKDKVLNKHEMNNSVKGKKKHSGKLKKKRRETKVKKPRKKSTLFEGKQKKIIF